jgi:hypothetical protein
MAGGEDRNFRHRVCQAGKADLPCSGASFKTKSNAARRQIHHRIVIVFGLTLGEGSVDVLLSKLGADPPYFRDANKPIARINRSAPAPPR